MENLECNSITYKKLKRVVVKEELVALTGDIFKAIILNQFLYWSERVKDFDKFILEEKLRAEKHGENVTINLQNGWIYKTADELTEETMLGVSAVTMRSHIKKLVEMGYISERLNPHYKWDKTKQYRVELLKIETDLQKIGYTLEGYKTETKNISTEPKNIELREKESLVQNKTSLDCNNENLGAIPEITTEITNKEDLSINQSEITQNEKTDRRKVLEPEINDNIKDQTEEQEPTLNFTNGEELLANLVLRTGATKKQICRAIQRTKKFESQGKVKKSFLGLLLSVIETVKTEDIAKSLVEEIKGGDQANDTASEKRKKEVIKSLYMS